MNSSIRISIVVFIGLVVACESPVQPIVEESGIDLSAWKKVGDDPWRQSEFGVEAGPGDALGFLVSTKFYADFRLSIEYWVEDDTNSGIFIRCSSKDEISPDTCYEINIWDSHPNQASRTGSVVKIAEPLAHINGLGRWVRVNIETDGDRIRAMFDGELTVDLEDDRSPSGFIALQYGGTGTLKFRNLIIESN